MQYLLVFCTVSRTQVTFNEVTVATVKTSGPILHKKKNTEFQMTCIRVMTVRSVQYDERDETGVCSLSNEKLIEHWSFGHLYLDFMIDQTQSLTFLCLHIRGFWSVCPQKLNHGQNF